MQMPLRPGTERIPASLAGDFLHSKSAFAQVFQRFPYRLAPVLGYSRLWGSPPEGEELHHRLVREPLRLEGPTRHLARAMRFPHRPGSPPRASLLPPFLASYHGSASHALA